MKVGVDSEWLRLACVLQANQPIDPSFCFFFTSEGRQVVGGPAIMLMCERRISALIFVYLAEEQPKIRHTHVFFLVSISHCVRKKKRAKSSIDNAIG